MLEFKDINEMTDREVLEEILTLLRSGAQFVEQMSQSPMAAAMMPVDPMAVLQQR